MKTKEHQYSYSEKPKGASTSHVQIEDDKVTASIETKCPICQGHHDILGLTDAFDLRIKEGILITIRATTGTRCWTWRTGKKQSN